MRRTTPELVALFRKAMDIWFRELPSIPLIQWYHRIPHNETYWKKLAPRLKNPYVKQRLLAPQPWLLVLLNLEPTR